jgi:hypothetical protein
MTEDQLQLDDDTDTPARRESYDPTDIASDEEAASAKVPPGDDVEAWTKASAPFLELIEQAPQHMKAIKMRAARLRLSTKLAEECVWWLESRGAITKFKRWDGTPCWKLPGAQQPDDERKKQEPERAAKAPTKPRSVAMAKGEWVSTAEAMKLTKMGKSTLCRLGATGLIKSRKAGDGLRAPREFLRSSLMTYQPDFLSSPESDTPPRKQRAATKPKKERAVPREAKPNGKPAPTSERSVLAQWVAQGYKLGRITAEEALAQLVELVG